MLAMVTVVMVRGISRVYSSGAMYLQQYRCESTAMEMQMRR